MNRVVIACGLGMRAALLISIAACSTLEVAAVKPDSSGQLVAGQCPEVRTTARAPESHLQRVNPLADTAENLQRGRDLYLQDGRTGSSCASCHGTQGDGKGEAGAALDPPPRNFTCAQTMAGLTDGQLYWVIEHGSGNYHEPSRQAVQQIERPGHSMPFAAMRGFGNDLSPTEIWQLALYIRSLQRQAGEGAT